MGRGVQNEWETAAEVMVQSWDDTGGIGTGGEDGEVEIYNQPICFPIWSGFWVSRVCMLELQVGIKQ